MGYNGTVVYDLLGSGSDGNSSAVGMTHGGLYHIYNDQCIEIVGGQRVDGGGVCVNIVGSSGDVTITAMSSGDVKVTGRNIILDADKNVEINAGGDFRVNASNSINMSSNTCYIKAPYGKIRVREVGWMGGVFARNKCIRKCLECIMSKFHQVVFHIQIMTLLIPIILIKRLSLLMMYSSMVNFMLT